MGLEEGVACAEVLGQEPTTPQVWRELQAGGDRLVTVSRLFSSLAILFSSSGTRELPYLLGVSSLPLPLFMTATV